jgi:hypothetical protein
MKRDVSGRVAMKILFLISILSFVARVNGQDSLYAKKIDNIWMQPAKRHAFLKRKEVIGETRFDYYFHKNPLKLRSIAVWHLPSKPGQFIFFYINDDLVMTSPMGQQPYYVFDGNLVFAKEKQHTAEEIQSLIKKGNEYLLQAYKKIGRK